MNELAVSVFWSVLILTLFQILFTFPFAKRLHPPKLIALPIPDPKVTVVLCLRGADPLLARCLQGLLNQDYSNYTVQIVVDRRDDPAWDIVARILQHQTTVETQVRVLRERLETCSFKCSALIQASTDLDPDCDIIALIDGDTVPHATWLRELITPLEDDRIGATTGSPWYVPTGRQPGTLIRYLWNATTVVMMYFNQIPWSGSIAFKTERLQQTQLLEDWQHALSDAVPLYHSLHKHKLRIQLVPSLMMVNDSECTLPNFMGWATRQMVMVRLYHPAWWGTIAASLVNSLVLGRAGVLLLMTALTGQWLAMTWIGGGLALYALVMAGLVGLLQQRVKRILQARGELMRSGSVWSTIQLILGILCVQGVQTVTLLAALGAKTIKWGGITYQIKGSWKIRVLRYRPYETLSQSAAKVSSLY